MAEGIIVATAIARFHGRCQDCHTNLKPGDVVYKVAEEGPTTQHGQGPGRWIGECCEPNHLKD